MNPKCDKPGCGRKLHHRPASPMTELGQWCGYYCPATPEEHRLCARVYELEAKLVEAAKPCEWTEDEDEDIWTATCGLVEWCFNDGGPIENRVHFCIGCGHPVVVKSKPQDAAKEG